MWAQQVRAGEPVGTRKKAQRGHLKWLAGYGGARRYNACERRSQGTAYARDGPDGRSVSPTYEPHPPPGALRAAPAPARPAPARPTPNRPAFPSTLHGDEAVGRKGTRYKHAQWCAPGARPSRTTRALRALAGWRSSRRAERVAAAADRLFRRTLCTPVDRLRRDGWHVGGTDPVPNLRR